MHNNDHNVSKEKKRLTNNTPKLEKSKVERLVFYVLGKSKSALLPGQIEKEVQKHNSNQRPNYVYEVLKKRAPDSSELTHTLLFRYNQFFDKNEEIIGLGEEEKNKLKSKLCSKIFDFYHIRFGWKDKSELEYQPEEKLDEGKKSIEIIIRSKKNAKYIKIILQANKASKKDFAKLLDNEREVPIKIQRKRGDGYVYSTAYDDSYHLNCYLDKLAISIDKKNDAVSFPNPVYEKDGNEKVKKSYYAPNLRGFLRFLLLTKRNSKFPYKEINRVIETLAENDFEWSLQNETKSFNNTDIPLEKQTSFHVNNFYKHRVNESFSFLSCYTRYKKRLPKRYAANILIEAAEELEGKLETMDIPRLKYEVTSRFFIAIEEYFWEGYFKPSIINLKTRITDMGIIPDELFTVLKNFQEENRNYLKGWKEKELQDHLKITEYYNEQNYKNELKRKVLNFLEVTNKSVVSIKEILDSNNIEIDTDNPWGATMSVIKEICESYRQDYVTRYGEFLIKRTKIEEIQKILKPEMTFEKVKELLRKSEIYDENVIIYLVKLAGYRIRDVKPKDIIILMDKLTGHNRNDWDN